MDGRLARNNSIIAAAHFHSERLRQKTNDFVPDPHDILGAAVDNHHKSKSLLTTTLLRSVDASMRSYDNYDSRNSIIFKEVDEFSDDEEDDDVIKALGFKSGGLPSQPLTPDQTTPSQPEVLESPTNSLRPLVGPGVSASRKGTTQSASQLEADPASLLRRLRSQRSVTARVLDAGRGSTYSSSLKNAVDIEDEDEVTVFKDLTSTLRGKSFLARPEVPESASAADDMLAQIRGPKWSTDSISKSSRCMSIRAPDSPQTMVFRSEQSMSCGSPSVPALPPIGSKSFSAGKRSGGIPGVNVDSSPLNSERTRTPAVGVRASTPLTSSRALTPTSTLRQPPPEASPRQPAQAGSSAAGGSLFSKLRQMVKH